MPSTRMGNWGSKEGRIRIREVSGRAATL
jgi:hypothetical protein